MARAKKRADFIYNERRRATRLLNNLKKDYKGKNNEVVNKYMERLEKAIVGTYSTNSRDVIKKNTLDLYKMTHSSFNNNKVSRNNMIFEREVRIASRGDTKTSLGSGRDSQLYVKIFYASTRRIWQGKKRELRNKAIMDYLGVKDFKQAFFIVMASNIDAVKAVRNRARMVGSSSVDTMQDDFYKDKNYNDNEGSPEELQLVSDIAIENAPESILQNAIRLLNENIDELGDIFGDALGGVLEAGYLVTSGIGSALEGLGSSLVDGVEGMLVDGGEELLAGLGEEAAEGGIAGLLAIL